MLIEPGDPRNNTEYYIIQNLEKQDLGHLSEICRFNLQNQRAVIYCSTKQNQTEKLKEYIIILNYLANEQLFNIREISIDIKKIVNNYRIFNLIYNVEFFRYYYPLVDKINIDKEQTHKMYLTKIGIRGLTYDDKSSSLVKRNKQKNNDGVYMIYNGQGVYLLMRKLSWQNRENYLSISFETCNGQQTLYFLPDEKEADGVNLNINTRQTLNCFYQGVLVNSNPEIQKKVNKTNLSKRILYFVPRKPLESVGSVSTVQYSCELRDYLNKFGYEEFRTGYMTRMLHPNEIDLIHEGNFDGGYYLVTALDKEHLCLHKYQDGKFIKKTLNELDQEMLLTKIIRILIIDKTKMSALIKKGILVPEEEYQL